MVQRVSEVTASFVHWPHLVLDLQRSGVGVCADNVSDIAHITMIVGNAFIYVLIFYSVLRHRRGMGSRIYRCESR